MLRPLTAILTHAAKVNYVCRAISSGGGILLPSAFLLGHYPVAGVAVLRNARVLLRTSSLLCEHLPQFADSATVTLSGGCWLRRALSSRILSSIFWAWYGVDE